MNVLLAIDDFVKKCLISVGQVTLLATKGITGIFLPPYNIRLLLREIDNFGSSSLLLVDLIALFTGMVMALQTIYGLSMYGAEIYVGSVVSLSIVRELGPVLTSIMVGARVGSGIAAEIGSMQVTEQIDAMRALGASPVKKLVTPKILAAMITLPLLTVTANIIGIFGGMVIALSELEIDQTFYINSVLTTIKISDLLSGISKTVFFGLIIAIIGCYFGLKTTGGTTGVGRSTTITVVTISILILIADFFLTKLFFIIF
ncbi:MAG: MlaE family ABC transporter permease [Candidatus Loosdrechtia sp.]|uniref:MlaE family ABC transporter permease n=1 Tax=Candidatus Loosdrechtia sp. TaxID=3101272 RepID=UPI003A6700EA|nr:MAG: ABC transporter permease [Candidatus Jettenia sp. AMX2]